MESIGMNERKGIEQICSCPELGWISKDVDRVKNKRKLGSMQFDEATLVNYKAKKSKQACRTKKVRTECEEQCEKSKTKQNK